MNIKNNFFNLFFERMAPFLFAISILAASQSSIITTTIAGQLIINVNSINHNQPNKKSKF